MRITTKFISPFLDLHSSTYLFSKMHIKQKINKLASLLLSLTGGTRETVTPLVREMKQSSGTTQSMRCQSSSTASSPVVTSTRDDPYDLTHRLHYLASPLVGASDDGGDHGGSEERDGCGTPEEATASQPKAQTSINELRST